MRKTHHRPLHRWHVLLPWLGLLLLFGSMDARPARAQVFYPDDPVVVDPDRQPIEAPSERALSDYYDYVENGILDVGESGGRAQNINTLGEVPRSSWYTPRHYADRLSLDELKRGARRGGPPEPPFRVVDDKSEGKGGGFWVEDARGDRYLFKVDQKATPEMGTGAEAIGTHLFHALGYHVPQNSVVFFDRSDLEAVDGATFQDARGRAQPLDADHIEGLLEQMPPTPSGGYRALASKFLEGQPLGPFRYYGTRPDDPNDLFPHEHRRELRGMRVFAAWINHDDSRSVNSFDAFIETDDGGYVRHHLIDFGTILGGSPLGPKEAWAGNEYILDAGTIFKSIVSLGFVGRPWRRADPPDIPAVGHFEATYFDPTQWRPQYRNPAFRNMDADDAFWAARQVAHFTDEEIRALVETGRYTNPETARYLTETLITRRDKIARAYLGHGGGFDRFRITDKGHLAFDDMLDHSAFDTDPAAVAPVDWYPFSNATGERGDTIGARSAEAGTVAVPETTEEYLVGVLQRMGAADHRTEVYLRQAGETWEVVGVRRSASGTPSAPPVWTQIPVEL
jgi:hypothetical protein